MHHTVREKIFHILRDRDLVWILPLIAICIAIFGCIQSMYAYTTTEKKLQRALTDRVESYAALIDPYMIKSLSGTRDDANKDSYMQLKRQLLQLISKNSDANFIYVLGVRGREIVFFGDSEITGSPTESPPGQKYPGTPRVLLNTIATGQTNISFYSDSWGDWVTGFAVIRDDAKNIIAIIGMDLPQSTYYHEVWVNTATPLIISAMFALILFGLARLAQQEHASMRLKAEFITIAAHDLRNPLTGMRWTSELALKSDSAESAWNALKKIRTSCDSLLLSVNELLDSARSSERVVARVKGRCDLAQLIAEAVNILSLSAEERHVTISTQILSEMYTFGDRELLRRVLVNVLSNAIKYSPENSTISITGTAVDAVYKIIISDQGIGIPSSEIAHVFDGFFRAHNAQLHTQAGTGLGLFYCRKVITEHRGSITLTSSEGTGTTVTITLPNETAKNV